MNDETTAAIEKLRTQTTRVYKVAQRNKTETGVWVDPSVVLLGGSAQALLAHFDGEPLRQAKALEALRDENTRLLKELENDALRIATAVAAGREEQREACVRHVAKHDADPAAAALVQDTPLTATPMEDEMREATEANQSLIKECHALRNLNDDMDAIDEALRKENAALRARIAELETQVEAQRDSSQRHMNGRESYWVEQRTKWIAECDRIGESCKWHADRAVAAEARVSELEATLAKSLANRITEKAAQAAPERQVAAVRAICARLIEIAKDTNSPIWAEGVTEAADDVIAAMDEAAK